MRKFRQNDVRRSLATSVVALGVSFAATCEIAFHTGVALWPVVSRVSGSHLSLGTGFLNSRTGLLSRRPITFGCQRVTIAARASKSTAEIAAYVPVPKTVKLQPGALGVELDLASGRVKQVLDGAAKEAGVQPGWVFRAVDGDPYTFESLKAKVQGDVPYAITYTISRPNPTAIFDTSAGLFKAEIFLDRVPITASNFIDLADVGFYDGIHFHRVIPDFMIQFGCPYAKDPKDTRAGTGGPQDGMFKNLATSRKQARTMGGCIKDEFLSRDSNEPGTIAMANAGPNSGGSQFFINLADNQFLDWFTEGQSRHPVFAKVIEGYELCEKISKVPTSNDNPEDPITMNSVTITWS